MKQQCFVRQIVSYETPLAFCVSGFRIIVTDVITVQFCRAQILPKLCTFLLQHSAVWPFGSPQLLLSMVMLLPLPEQVLCLAKRPYCLPGFLKTTSRWSVGFFGVFCKVNELSRDFIFFLPNVLETCEVFCPMFACFSFLLFPPCLSCRICK